MSTRSATSPPAGPAELQRRPYAEVRPLIRDGDTLLMRPRVRWWAPHDWATLLIWLASHSGHVHAAKAGRLCGALYVIQQTAGPEHIERLSEIVRRWPGKIDVFRPRFRHPVQGPQRRCMREMADLCGRRYGWRNLFRLLLRYLPLLWQLLPADYDEAESNAWPPFCSMAVSRADRTGGVDPCIAKPDRLTTPSDLALSPDYDYQFTLV